MAIRGKRKSCAVYASVNASYICISALNSQCATVRWNHRKRNRVHWSPRCTSHHRCPSDNPTWCISKSSTATWVQKHGQCDDSIGIQCDATDICATVKGLFFSYNYSNINHASAHSCVKTKCEEQWNACCDANPGHEDCDAFGQGEKRLLSA